MMDKKSALKLLRLQPLGSRMQKPKEEIMLFAIDDLVKLSRAGGGFSVSASIYSVDDLLRIARAASQGNAQLTATNINLTIEDLIRIGRAARDLSFSTFPRT